MANPNLYLSPIQYPSRRGTLRAAVDQPAVTLDLDQADAHQLLMGGARTLTPANNQPGQQWLVRLVQDGVGSRLVTWWPGINWPAGTAPTLTTTANKADVFRFLETSDTPLAYDGYIVGQNIPSFQPAMVPGLVADWNADSLGLADGAAVALWKDSSPNGNDLSAAGTAQPTYKATGFQSLPGVLFNGTANQLAAVTANNITAGNGYTCYVALIMTDATKAQPVVYNLQGPTTAALCAISFSGNTALSGFSPYFGYRGSFAYGANPGTGGNCFTNQFLTAGILTTQHKGGPTTVTPEFATYRNDSTISLTGIGTIGGTTNATTIGGDGAGNNLNGTIRRILIFNQPVSMADHRRIWSHLVQTCGLAALTGPAAITLGPQISCEGNSITLGYGASSLPANSYPDQLQTLLGSGTWTRTNYGVNGQTTEGMETLANGKTDSLYNPARSRNICIASEGTNSINGSGDSAATAYASLTKMILGRKAAGFQVVVWTTLPAPGLAVSNPGFEAVRVSLNDLVKANSARADRVVDVAADPYWTILGSYQADGVHPTDAGYAHLANQLYPTIAAM